MCGICGFTGHLLENEKNEILKRMMDRIIHRGPDSGGIHTSDGIAMGFRRLSIMDLNFGDQPMYNEDKSMVVTFNGEIYN
ncbi:MAG: asparagine synthetase B, partial [Lachnospiraceae bacterium]|nr:asparagine synthetase B [Lachnospiraceae bacterium]